MRAIALSFFLAAVFACGCNAQSKRLAAPAENFGLSSGPWIWRQSWQAGLNLGPSGGVGGSVLCGGTIPASIARSAYSISSPIGYVPQDPSSGSPYYAINNGPDNSGYACMFVTRFNNVATGDFVTYPQPYIGPITEAITMYIPATGAQAWTVPGSSGYIAFELDMSPDTQDYSLETCIDFYITTAGTINIGFSYGGDAGGLPPAWPNSYVTPFATVTSNDFYTITETSYRAGNLTTDPALTLMSVYTSKHQLVGYLVRAQNANSPTNLANMSGPGTNLNQTDQITIAYVQSGLLPGGNMAYSEMGYFPGFPNNSRRPKITNSYVAAGATAGSAYSGFTLNAPGATSYSAQFQSGISTLSINTSTGAITGTPATAGTYYFVAAAANEWGADAQLFQLVVSNGASASAILLGIP